MEQIVIFDLDNTLVDRQGAFSRWTLLFAEAHGLGPQDAEWICQAESDGFEDRRVLFSAVRRKFAMSASVDDLLTSYWATYPLLFEPDQAVGAALGDLRSAGWKIAIATNGGTAQHAKIERAGLSSLVDGICVSEEIGYAKPDPRIFEEALRLCGFAPESFSQTWMVGDDPRCDIGGAGALGMRTAWIHRGREWKEESFRPDEVTSSVPDAVQRILGDSPPLS